MSNKENKSLFLKSKAFDFTATLLDTNLLIFKKKFWIITHILRSI